MASIFRSEEMALCQLFLSSEASYNCVSELGEIGLVQFRDLNPNVNIFQRKFVHEVRRCEEMERKLRYLEHEANKDEIKIVDNGENPEAPQPREMIDFEATFEKLENELKEVNTNAETLKRNFLELTELKYVLQSSQIFFAERDSEPSSNINQTLITSEEGASGPVQLGFVAGVIVRERMASFERMLWRVCRGNAFVRQQDIEVLLEDPSTGEKLQKLVFLIFFQGEQLKSKVKKICDGCKATMYPCPESSTERKEMIDGVKNRLEDLSTVLSQTNDHRHRVLAAAAKQLRLWFIKVRKIKGIYHTLNMFNFDVTNKCLIAEAWIPEADLPRIKMALCKGTERSGSTIEPILNRMETTVAPPTFHRKNKFTAGFQNLIDAYGICTYREVNPGLYTTTTFPFLFAVMFGDCGHGFIMTLFGLFMLIREKAIIAQKSKNEIWNMLFGGRYIIFMMGCFSIYTGFIYNDVFSKSFNMYGSRFHAGNLSQEAILVHHESEYMLDPGYPGDYEGAPYPVGIDPMWQLAINKINFLNSYKMKISIIVGVLHMLFGIALSLVNHLHFGRMVNILCEFIPQVIFLLGLFGYLCVMVIYKWIHYGAGFDPSHDTRCAPSVLILFIDMALFKQEKPLEDFCDSAYLYDGQYLLQVVLVLICLICVPILLLPKPFFLKYQHEKKVEGRVLAISTDIQESDTPETSNGTSNGAKANPKGRSSDAGQATAAGGGGHDGEEEFEFSEVFIHQAIHTIEFVLGCVSHTASYLRLWALSLAHAQLSEVLWMMVLKIGLAQPSTVGCIILYLIFAAWAFLTISILVVMEGLSAFLHTLRLHWVEFCSKFLEGNGYLFTPFSFKHFVEEDDE